MIDTEERLAELRAAYDTLVAFNLWLRGKIEAKDAADPKEIGEAIETACGALWSVINSEDLADNSTLRRRLEIAEKSLKSCEAANESLKIELYKLDADREAKEKLEKRVKEYEKRIAHLEGWQKTMRKLHHNTVAAYQSLAKERGAIMTIELKRKDREAKNANESM